jgi:hypothetical protein
LLSKFTSATGRGGGRGHPLPRQGEEGSRGRGGRQPGKGRRAAGAGVEGVRSGQGRSAVARVEAGTRWRAAAAREKGGGVVAGGERRSEAARHGGDG